MNIVLVSLTSTVSVHDKPVEKELLAIRDALRIVARYTRFNMLAIEVADGKQDTYAAAASSKVFVEQAHAQGTVRGAGIVHPAYRHYGASWVWDEYEPSPRTAYNHKVTVAILDSGIAPHESLPSLTWTDLHDSSRYWWHYRHGDWEVRKCINYEAGNIKLWQDPCPVDVDGIPDYSQYQRYRQLSEDCVAARQADMSEVIHWASFNYVSNTLDVYDRSNHGTAVAGLMGGYESDYRRNNAFRGVCPGAQMLVLRVLDDRLTATETGVLAAMQRAIDLDVDVILLGFSAAASAPSIKHACDKLAGTGVVLVAPAGNAGKEGLDVPATSKAVLSVGSITRSRRPSPFSNRAATGETLDVVSFGGEHPTGDVDEDWKKWRYISAPGLHNGFQGVSGTSFSAALAAGCVASRISRRLFLLAMGDPLPDVDAKYPGTPAAVGLSSGAGAVQPPAAGASAAKVAPTGPVTQPSMGQTEPPKCCRARWMMVEEAV